MTTVVAEITLREHLDAVLATHRTNQQATFDALDKSIALAAQANAEAHKALYDRMTAIVDYVRVTIDERVDKVETLGEERVAALRREVLDSSASTLRAVELGERLQVERVEALRREAAAALLSATTAIDKAERATERRFEAVNEFRAQLSDQAALFIPREVADSQIGELRGQIAALTTRLDQQSGRSAGLSAGWGFLVGGIGVLATIIAIVITLAGVLGS